MLSIDFDPLSSFLELAAESVKRISAALRSASSSLIFAWMGARNQLWFAAVSLQQENKNKLVGIDVIFFRPCYIYMTIN
jgi:hypothetical protein